MPFCSVSNNGMNSDSTGLAVADVACLRSRSMPQDYSIRKPGENVLTDCTCQVTKPGKATQIDSIVWHGLGN